MTYFNVKLITFWVFTVVLVILFGRSLTPHKQLCRFLVQYHSCADSLCSTTAVQIPCAVFSSITQQWVIRNFISVLINVIHDVYNKEAYFSLREIPQGGKYIKSKYFIFEDNLEWGSCSSVIKQQVHIDCVKWWHWIIHPFIKGR